MQRTISCIAQAAAFLRAAGWLRSHCGAEEALWPESHTAPPAAAKSQWRPCHCGPEAMAAEGEKPRSSGPVGGPNPYLTAPYQPMESARPSPTPLRTTPAPLQSSLCPWVLKWRGIRLPWRPEWFARLPWEDRPPRVHSTPPGTLLLPRAADRFPQGDVRV